VTTTTTTARTAVATKASTTSRTENDTSCCHPKSKDASKCCQVQEPPLFEPQVIAAGVLLIFVGTYLLVYGFPLFRITVAVIGFIFGGMFFKVLLGTYMELTELLL